MGFRKLCFRYFQFGGARLLKAYQRLGVASTVWRQGIKLLTGTTTRDDAYAEIRKLVNRKLQQEFLGFIRSRVSFYELSDDKHQCLKTNCSTSHGSSQYTPVNSIYNRKIWTCWLQGFEKAPPIVHFCQDSIKKHVTDREIVYITYNNYKEYVTLPEIIINKYEMGHIPPALFADLLRLEILIKYGGTWMDATIFLSDGGVQLKELLDADLFMFQAFRKGDNRFQGISNWFISAKKRSRPLMVLRDVLEEYWTKYNVTLNYYMFHDFFYTISQYYPEIITSMPKKNRVVSLQLLFRKGYEIKSDGIYFKDESWVKDVLKCVCVHKLDYKA